MKSLTVAAALCLTACAQGYEPVVDPLRATRAYERDLADCRRIAERVHPAVPAAGGAVLGTVGGTALGAVATLFTGDLTDPLAGAVIGGTAGAALGNEVGARQQRAVIDDCLGERGHTVLR